MTPRYRSLDEWPRGSLVLEYVAFGQRFISRLVRHLLLARQQPKANRDPPPPFAYAKNSLSHLSGLDFIDSMRSDGFEKAPRTCRIEPRIGGLDQEKKSVTARQLEPIYVENRVIGHRQAIERQDAKESRQGRYENRQLKSHGNERRPTVERPAAHVNRIVDDGKPIL